MIKAILDKCLTIASRQSKQHEMQHKTHYFKDDPSESFLASSTKYLIKTMIASIKAPKVIDPKCLKLTTINTKFTCF